MHCTDWYATAKHVYHFHGKIKTTWRLMQTDTQISTTWRYQKTRLRRSQFLTSCLSTCTGKVLSLKSKVFVSDFSCLANCLANSSTGTLFIHVFGMLLYHSVIHTWADIHPRTHANMHAHTHTLYFLWLVYRAAWDSPQLPAKAYRHGHGSTFSVPANSGTSLSLGLCQWWHIPETATGSQTLHFPHNLKQCTSIGYIKAGFTRSDTTSLGDQRCRLLSLHYNSSDVTGYWDCYQHSQKSVLSFNPWTSIDYLEKKHKTNNNISKYKVVFQPTRDKVKL